MKKHILCAFFIAATLLAGCGGAAEDARLSERRSSYYTASGETGAVTVVSGVREEPYKRDGKVCALRPYTLITYMPKDFDVDAALTFTVQSGGALYGGTLLVHPFAASFSAELGEELTGALTVTVKSAGKSAVFELTNNVTADMLGYRTAVERAVRELAPSGEYEVRARIIKNPLRSDDSLCWHVAFYTGTSSSGVLLDPRSGEVIAKKPA